MLMKYPSKPISITSPRYDGVLDVKTGILTITRNDKDGKLLYEQVKPYLKERV